MEELFKLQDKLKPEEFELKRKSILDKKELHTLPTLQLKKELSWTLQNQKKTLSKKEREELNRKLFDAIKQGELRAMMNAVRKGADVNVKDEQGKTPLILAATRGEYSVVKFLVENGAEVDAKDSDGKIALEYAKGSEVEVYLAKCVIFLVARREAELEKTLAKIRRDAEREERKTTEKRSTKKEVKNTKKKRE